MMRIRELSKAIQVNKYAINQKNLGTLRLASAIGMGLQLALFLATFPVSAIAKNRNLYGSMAFVFIVIFILANVFCKRHEKLILPVAYLFLGAAFTLAIILGTYLTPNGFAVTFCVLFFALPQLFIDKIIRLEIFQVFIAFLFCLLTFHIKPVEVASIDAVNVISFWLIAIPLNYSVVKTKVNDIDNQRKIIWENERDGLTQIYKKDTAEQLIREHMEATKNIGALMVMDIDFFKGINDTYGHQTGDQAIQFFSHCISSSLRSCDVVGRFGGDEFVVYMMNAGNSEDVVKKAEQIRNKVQLAKEENGLKEEISVSISIGIALYPDDGNDYHTLFEKADQALYRAKEKGKNQVECFE